MTKGERSSRGAKNSTHRMRQLREDEKSWFSAGLRPLGATVVMPAEGEEPLLLLRDAVQKRIRWDWPAREAMELCTTPTT